LSTLKSITAPLLSVDNYGLQISVGSEEWKNFRFKTIRQFHINTIEDYIRYSKRKEFPLPPHRKEVTDLIFLTNGTVLRSKGLDEYEFSKNQFFFLPAFQITTMQTMSANAAGFYCHFDPDIFFKKLFQKELLHQFSFMHFTGNPIVQVDKKTADFVVLMLSKLLEEYRKDDDCNLDFVAATLLSLFFAINHFAKPADPLTGNAAYRIANQYKSLLLKNIYEHQKVTYYADKLAVSPEHLNRSVKSAFGKTAHEYLDEMILLEAKVLLRQSSLNVSEIAYKIGKENPGDFIRFFKSKTGLTPKQYRTAV
jgi:AraC-like DNA-binding protein